MPADRAAAILVRLTAAQHALSAQIRELPPGAAEHQPVSGAWSAAQIVCHVAMANDWTAEVLTGTTPLAQPAPPGFIEQCSPVAVPRQKTFPLPAPAVIGGDAALYRLSASGHRLARAIASLTPERGTGYTVTLPFGMISLFELADLTAAHVARHIEQVERVLTGP